MKCYRGRKFLQEKDPCLFFTSDQPRHVFFNLCSYPISRIFIRTCVATNSLEVTIFRRLTR